MTALDELKAEMESDLLEFFKGAVLHVVQNQNFDMLRAWIEKHGTINELMGENLDSRERLRVVYQLSRDVWNHTPLQRNGYRPEPLIDPDPDEPCPCGSGSKYGDCCSDFEYTSVINSEACWGVLIDHLKPSQIKKLQALNVMPPFAIGFLADRFLEEGKTRKAVSLLESIFDKDLKSLDERYKVPLMVLCTAYVMQGKVNADVELLERVASQASDTLAFVALKELSLVYVRNSDSEAAWECFNKASALVPNNPELALIEVALLLTEKRFGEAKNRAAWWLKKFEGSADVSEPMMEFLMDVSEKPEDLGNDWAIDEFLDSLDGWVMKVSNRQVPSYGLESWGTPAEEGRNEGSESFMLVPPPEIARLEKKWLDVWEYEKPFSTDLGEIYIEEAIEPDGNPEWFAFLKRHPEAWDSCAILDDLAGLLWEEAELSGVAGSLLVRILDRGEDILNRVIQKLPPGAVVPWEILGNRPCLRLADRNICLLRDGDEEKILLMKRMLSLNPHDNHGYRSLLMDHYLKTGRDREATALGERYVDDFIADVSFGRALAFYRLDDKSTAKKALKQACKLHPKVPKFLLSRRPKKPRTNPGTIQVGGDDEAWLYREDMLDTWKATPGALEWLAANTRT